MKVKCDDIEELIPLFDVADALGVSRSTMYSRAWRRKYGLPVVKLGGKIVGVRREDLSRVLRPEFGPETRSVA